MEQQEQTQLVPLQPYPPAVTITAPQQMPIVQCIAAQPGVQFVPDVQQTGIPSLPVQMPMT